MFAIIYHWKLKPGATFEEFQKVWHEGSLAIYKERGSFGSSLHKANDGTLVAYARWPNKEAWQKMMSETAKTSGNKKLVESVEPPIELDLIDDLIELKQYKD